jgi:hypothetical protein
MLDLGLHRLLDGIEAHLLRPPKHQSLRSASGRQQTHEHPNGSAHNRDVRCHDRHLGRGNHPPVLHVRRQPSGWNVLTRNLITLVTVAVMIVFLAGLRELIRHADSRYEWVANIAHGAGLVLVSITMVAHSMEVGGVLHHPSGSIDPTVDGPLAAGSMLLHGSVGRIVTAVLLAAAGYAILQPRPCPPGPAGRRTSSQRSTWPSCPRSTSAQMQLSSTALLDGETQRSPPASLCTG